MSDSVKLLSVALDYPDAGQLAACYAAITGGTVIFRDDRWAVVRAPGARIVFQAAAGYVRPAWPDPASSMQMHLDFYIDDADAAEARVLAAGRPSTITSPVTTSASLPTPPVTRSACAPRTSRDWTDPTTRPAGPHRCCPH